MPVDILIREKGTALEGVRHLLGRLFEQGVVEYLLVPQEISRGRTLTQTLVSDPHNLKDANPFSPVLPVNSASIVSRLTHDKPSRKLGAVLKPCEIRALVELAKLGRAHLDHLVIIGTECLGSCEVEDYAAFIDGAPPIGEERSAWMLTEMRRAIGSSDTEFPIPLRAACRICTHFTPPLSDIVLRVLTPTDGICVAMEEELAQKLGYAADEPPEDHETIERIASRRAALRATVCAEFRNKMQTITDFADATATCTRCFACQSACPICHCRVCFFSTETFEPESERYFLWAEKEEVLRMPPEILLYHLTRLNHVASSCVGCGMCESACSRNLPLTSIFAAVGDAVQKQLDYRPGQSLDDPIPLATYRNGEE